MIDVDTLLPILYVMVDDCCQSYPIKQDRHPGPQAVLSCSEVVTLALFGQWAQFPSDRALYRYAQRHVRTAFPTLPDRSRFNWLRSGSMQRSSRHLACTWSTCWMFSAAPMSALIRRALPREPLLSARAFPQERLACVGRPAQGADIADKGFAGDKPHARWHELFGAVVITPPHQRSKRQWPKEWRRWLAHLRQVIESVFAKLLNTFRLARERPHALTGFQARPAAKIGLPNFCIWVNGHLQRPPLAFADLIDW